MKAYDLFPSKFMKVVDLEGQELTATISSVELEQVGDDKKPVAYFKGGKLKALVLNKTNFESIEEISGSDETDDWDGVKITLFPSTVRFNGQKVPCVRVKAPAVVSEPKQISLDAVEAAF
jgi:hypothetical protein